MYMNKSIFVHASCTMLMTVSVHAENGIQEKQKNPKVSTAKAS
jgi:hypothetical protein